MALKFLHKLSLFTHAVKQINIVLRVGFVIAVISLINYECHLVPLFWVNKFTTGLNTFFVQILYAYITGFIFYFIIEFTRQNKNRIAVLPIINNNSFYIHHRTDFLVNEICKANNAIVGHNVKEKEFGEFCNSINIHTTIVNVWFYPQCTFKEYVLRICEDINSNTDSLMGCSDLLDENWVNSIARISEDIRHIRGHLDVNGRASTLNLVQTYMWELYAESERIWGLSNKYHSEHYKAYRKQNPYFRTSSPDLEFKVKGPTM